MIIKMFECLFAGFDIGIDAFLKVLPIYNQLSGIEEQLISVALGIPAIIVSIVFLVPTIFKIFRKLLFS